MIREHRISLAARAFAIAASLGLSLALLDSVALQGTLMLAAVAAVAVAATISLPVSERSVLLTEAGISALIVGMAFPEGVLLVPYLVVPALLAGISVGLWLVSLVITLEVLSIATLVVLSGDFGQTDALLEILAPWLVTSLGVGLIGTRLRSFSGSSTAGDASYETARRLLNQLRTVARRLSSGLDTLALSDELLQAVHERARDTHSAVIVKTEGGVLSPLAFRGPQALPSLGPSESLVAKCWQTMEPEQELRASGLAGTRHRIALPLRVGTRMIGAVLIEAPEPIAAAAMTSLMSTLDEYALRLDAAMTFDEIRSLATMEERRRLAREIHDGVAQEIASIGYVVDDLTAQAVSDTQARKLRELRSELTRVVSELRLSIFDLRSEVSAGLGSALSDYVRQVGSRSGMTVHLTLDVAPNRLRTEVETELFRIVQEAITNVRKHAAATNLWVDCRIRPPSARITVRDDGAGLRSGRDDSYGLKIMRERATRIGATLDIRSSTANDRPGTCVTVSVGETAPEHHPLGLTRDVVT